MLRRWIWLLPTLLVAAIVLPAALFNVHGGIRISDDSLDFHIPQINQFIKAPFDLLSFTAFAPTFPGYHVAMAWLARLFGIPEVNDNVALMRFINAAFTLLAVAYALPLAMRTRYSDPRTSRRLLDALAVMLPFCLSWYIALTATYYGTEGLAHLCLVGVLWALVGMHPRRNLLAATLAALIFVRHIFAPILPIALLAHLGKSRPVRGILNDYHLKFAAIALLPAVAIIAIYVWQWGGLVPPGRLAEMNRSGLSPHSWLHALAFLGLTTFLFLPLEIRGSRDVVSGILPKILAGVLLLGALALWLAAPSDLDVAAGRWGSVIWSVAQRTPLVFGKSPAVLLLALIGAAFLAYVIVRGWRGERMAAEIVVLVLYLVGVGLTQAAHQRYVEPVTLLCLGVFFHRIGGERPLWTYAPVALFAAGSAGWSVYRLYYVFRIAGS
jgi:hypothetical protein